MTRRIGNTTYRIRVALSRAATESFEDKLLRLVRNDSALLHREEADHETQED